MDCSGYHPVGQPGNLHLLIQLQVLAVIASDFILLANNSSKYYWYTLYHHDNQLWNPAMMMEAWINLVEAWITVVTILHQLTTAQIPLVYTVSS